MECSADKTQSTHTIYREYLLDVFNHFLKSEVNSPPKRILSIGCKFIYEGEAILDMFPEATFKGIDIDERFIGFAKRQAPNLKNAIFEVGDATRKETFGKDPWDIILIRHPQVLGEFFTENKNRNLAKDWRIIIENSMEALKHDGVFFVIATSIEEGNIVLGYINSFREKMLVKVNRSNASHTNELFKDEQIIVAKKV